MMEPWISETRSRASIEADLAALLGVSIERVTYLAPASASGPAHVSFPFFDQVSMGVELTTSSGASLLCRWAMDGFSEGLSFGVGSAGADTMLAGFDVSAATTWSSFLGCSVTGVGIAWHEPNEYAPEAVLGVRMEFGNHGSIVVALGEAAHGGREITYMPDNLVVIFQEATARAYEPLGSSGSAWGSLIAKSPRR